MPKMRSFLACLPIFAGLNVPAEAQSIEATETGNPDFPVSYSLELTASSYGPEWPFSVERGAIICTPSRFRTVPRFYAMPVNEEPTLVLLSSNPLEALAASPFAAAVLKPFDGLEEYNRRIGPLIRIGHNVCLNKIDGVSQDRLSPAE